MPRDNARSRPNGGDSVYKGLGGSVSHGSVSYGADIAEALQQAVDNVCRRGDALLFALTSDGGAYSVRVLSGGRTHAFYPNTGGELLALLEGLANVEQA